MRAASNAGAAPEPPAVAQAERAAPVRRMAANDDIKRMESP
jgi:hypothetical protein